MSGKAPISLNKARKARARAEAAQKAETNRVAHGRTKAEKAAATKIQGVAERRLDQARREP